MKMQTSSVLCSIKALLDLETSPISHMERLASIGGGFTSILLIMLVSSQFAGAAGATLIITSMGASAVLLFAVPHGRLSQPWPVFGGHMVSALVGVTVAGARSAQPREMGLASDCEESLVTVA